MAKALYFSHDADARGDKKMLAMRYDYKLKGYGMFWIIVETMRTADNYELEYSDCTCKALAKQMDSTSTIVKKFIDDCINTYKLFKLRNGVFWSESFKARMAKMDEVREKRSEAGKKRWGKPYNANAKQMLSKCLTTKPNQTKPNQKKDIVGKKPTFSTDKIYSYTKEEIQNLTSKPFALACWFLQCFKRFTGEPTTFNKKKWVGIFKTAWDTWGEKNYDWIPRYFQTQSEYVHKFTPEGYLEWVKVQLTRKAKGDKK